MSKILISTASLALVFALGSAQAANVTVVANFTSFQMGDFGAVPADDALSINGVNVPFNGAAAFLDPSSVVVPINGGSRVTFAYNTSTPAQRGPNVFEFRPAALAQTVLGTGRANPFLLGTLTFTNGAFYPLSYVNFVLTTDSDDPAFDQAQLAGRVRLDVNVSTTNFLIPALRNRAALEEADYFTLESAAGQTYSELGSVRVFDFNRCLTADPTAPNCNTGTVDVYGYIDSLHFDRFANPSGGAFLDASVTGALTPAVPEPGTALLLLAGLVAAGVARGRR